MVLAAYSVVLFLVIVLGSPYWVFRILTSGKYREGLTERLGRVPKRLKPASPVIWVHAVSVGELLAAGRLVEELTSRAGGYPVLVSTTTRSGQRLARQRFGADRVFYFPLDFGWVVRRYLRRLRPALVVLLETEFWPNFLAECGRGGIPVAVANARISDRSFPRYRRLRFLWKPFLSEIRLFLAQSREDAARLHAIGAISDRVLVTGNLKFDVRQAETSALTSALRSHLSPGARILVCGSTGEGEEEMLLDAFPRALESHPTSVMILAPRHPERFSRVADLLRRRKLRWVRRSKWMKHPAAIAPGTVLLLDSIGELGSVYSLASIAFVGGSLIPSGGHNPLEPAQFGVAIVMGPSYENFRAIVEPMLDEQALGLVTPQTLSETLSELLQDRERADLMGARALEFFDSQAGATARVLQSLLKLLSGRSVQKAAR